MRREAQLAAFKRPMWEKEPNRAMKRFCTDVVILGAGAAGMMAALEAHEKGAEVLAVGKGAVGKGTCTSLAGGIFSVSSGAFSPEDHYKATMEAGRGLSDPSFVDLVVTGGRECIDRLKTLGALLLDFPPGCLVDNRNNSKEIPGIVLVESMKRILDARSIWALAGFHCLEFLIYPVCSPEARVFDAQGRDFIKELKNSEDLNQAIIHFRDTSSLLF